MSVINKIFTPDQKEIYNHFVLASPWCNPLQLWEWGEIKKSKRWQVTRLGFYADGQLAGVAQILERNLVAGKTMCYVPYGPVCDWNDENNLKDILRGLRSYLSELPRKNILYLKIEPPADSNETRLKTLKEAGWISQKQSFQPQHTSVVDLNPPTEKIFENLEKDTRYSVRRSEKEEVTIRNFTNPLNLQPVKEFYRLYQLTAQRGKFGARPLPYFEKIWKEMAPSGMVEIVEAWFKEKILAAAFIFKTKPKAFLLYAGSMREDTYKNKFPTYLMQWKIIESLKSQGFTSYDLWGIAPPQSKHHPFASITRFKMGFRGQEFNYLGSFDFPFSRLYILYGLLNKLYRVLSRKRG